MKNKNTLWGETQIATNHNQVNIPELVSGSSTQAVTQQRPQRQALKMPKQVRQYSSLTKRHGFTLIELLVVVLIIGILAAVALPQYQFAVAKSRYNLLMTQVTAIAQAQEIYYLTHGTYANNMEDLDIQLPGEESVLPWKPSVPAFQMDSNNYIRINHEDSYGTGVVGSNITNLCNNYIVYLNHSQTNPSKKRCNAHNLCNRELGTKICQTLSTDTEEPYWIQ